MGQQNPQQENVQQHSAEYAPYPTPATDYADATLGVPVGQTWGTQVMGTPDNPGSNPGNSAASVKGFVPGQPGYSGGPFPGSSGDLSSTAGSGSHQQPMAGSPGGYVDSPNPAGKDVMSKISLAFRGAAQQGGKRANNISKYFSSGHNVADTVVGRTSHGLNLLSQGGTFNVFRSTFGASPNEELRKSYVCYLSTSTGPVAGTLYISNLKLCFCSDRPLTYSPSPGQQATSHYKVVLPLERVKSVNPSANQEKPEEKYIQINMLDSHEFWFMGFVNYDKALKNLSEILAKDRPHQGPPPQGFQQDGGSQQFPHPPEQTAQYPPQQGGGGSYSLHQGGSGSYPPQHGGSGSYPQPGGSGFYPPQPGGSGSYPPQQAGSGSYPQPGGSGYYPPQQSPQQGGSYPPNK